MLVLEKALVTLSPVQQIHSNNNPSCQIDRGHIKVPHNKFWYTINTLVTEKYRFSKLFFLCVLQDQTSVEAL